MRPTPRFASLLVLAVVLLALSVSSVQAASIRPPKLYPLHVFQGGAQVLDCKRVNDRDPNYCNGNPGPWTDATVVKSFSGGYSVNYYHQRFGPCVAVNSSYGNYSCSWSVT